MYTQMRAEIRKRGEAVRRLLTTLAIGVPAIFAATSSASACSGYWVLATRAELRQPLSVNPDGSFSTVYANKLVRDEQGGYRAVSLQGGAIRNLKNGRIGQKISSSHEGCSGVEELLFVDCNALEGILLTGTRPEVQISGGNFVSIAEIQYPKGPIAFTKDTTVAKVEAIAQKHDIYYTRALYEHYDKMPEHKRYNPYQGCKIFYPDSPGAKR